ncbi:MAG: DUF3501 family protein [Pseudohongiellaceae bacterium]
MKKISMDDLHSNDVYEAQRPAFRQSMIEHKKNRRVALGVNASLHFEDYKTMHYQVQELMRSEKITRLEDIKEELAAYNPLIPDGSNLKVTFMIEFPDEDERRKQLARLIGIEEQVLIEIAGCKPVAPIADEDLERTTAEKTSAVHFMRYEFPPETIAAAKNGAAWTIICEHPNYRQKIQLTDSTRESLVKDFD